MMKSSRVSLKVKIIAAAVVCAQVFATAALAQSALVQVNDRPAVGMALLDKLMSGKSVVGDPVHYRVLANVYGRNSDLLIPAGSLAYGTVTRSKGSGMFGKRGQLDFTCDHVVLPSGEHVPLTGSSVNTSGSNGTAATVAVSVLVSPFGLLIKGGTVIVDVGTPVTMYIADGAMVSPTKADPTGIRAKFTPQNKDLPYIVGTVTGFDGSAYTIKTGDGRTTTMTLTDIKSISLDATDAQ